MLTLSINKPAISHQLLIETLVRDGYTRCPLATIPGDFSVRGNIVDIFGAGHHYPVRIEYDATGIERLVTFDAHTQRTLSAITEIQIQDMHAKHSVTFQSMAERNTEILSDWKPGDYLVHEDFGIGLYQGLIHLEIDAAPTEYLWLQYKGNDKLYVPLHQLPRLSKYGAAHATVNALYDGSWTKTKTKAKKHIETMVEGLLQLYQKRRTLAGIAYPEDSVWQLDFESGFPYSPTAGQLQAIAEIKADMENHAPMDRLLCGDVGYGKSEVIMRAIFKAAESGKQVALLVPTTVLARQHMALMTTRFSAFPFRIGMLSRLATDTDRILADLHTHRLDIVIGTHRLIQQDIRFADLGMIVIDEEQRFGVKAKECLKTQWPQADVLSVSATPIPRTLYMALTGARAMSTITDPPPGRKPILTAITPKTTETVQRAITEELSRNGQIFYVYNRISGLTTRANQLQNWFPKARIAIAHGKLSAKELDTIMGEFAAYRCDILICTSIVENGLDIPNANTIIIDNAPGLGLSQLYQLRGRVGRSDRQSYAYLLYDPDRLTDAGHRRLAAIKSFVALGSGYQLSLKDLDIRGAGTVLGYQQHGAMTAIGFDLYCALLQDTLQQHQDRASLPSSLHLYIPPDYVSDPRLRLALYQRLVKAEFPYQIDALIADCTDRFGAPPDAFLQVCNARRGIL